MRRTLVFLDQQGWLGGAQRVLEATLESLAPEYDCMVAFPDQGPFRSSLIAKGVETVDLPIGSYEPGRKSLLEMASFACRSFYCGLKLSLLIRKRDIALVYINGPRCLAAGTLAAWLTGRPAVFHLHLILARKPEIILARALSGRLSKVLACSGAAAASLVGHNLRLAEKTEILYNPLRKHCESLSPAEKSVAKDYFTVGIVGRITECKGQHLLLEAVASMSPELRHKVRILVVGSEGPGCESDAQYACRLRGEAESLRLDRQINWAGYQSDPGPCYDLMDVLVQPALAEAMCLAILEALDRGIPVIAARTGGIPEVVRNGFNGLLVSLEDKTALCRALTHFMRDQELRERLQAGARHRLDPRFSMKSFESRIRSTIGELCPSQEGDAEVRLGAHTD